MPETTLTPQALADGGYLQEANRLFWHPLGLEISIVVESGEPDQLTVAELDDDHVGRFFDDLTDDTSLANRELVKVAAADKYDRDRQIVLQFATRADRHDYLLVQPIDSRLQTPEDTDFLIAPKMWLDGAVFGWQMDLWFAELLPNGQPLLYALVDGHPYGWTRAGLESTADEIRRGEPWDDLDALLELAVLDEWPECDENDPDCAGLGINYSQPPQETPPEE